MPANEPDYSLEIVTWDCPAREAMIDIRFAVFVDEQQVPSDEELDAFDATATHAIVCDSDGDPVGTGRFYAEPDHPHRAHIGRMAVLASHRGRGYGAAIMSALIKEAQRHGFSEIALNAQTHAAPFYARFGFELVGEIYPICDIPHQDMLLVLPDNSRESNPE